MVDNLILTYHHYHLGHAGSERIVLALEQNFYIKRIGNKCHKITSTCELCLQAKPLNCRFETVPKAILLDRPNALVCADGHGRLSETTFGYKCISVMYDVFTKFVKIYP